MLEGNYKVLTATSYDETGLAWPNGLMYTSYIFLWDFSIPTDHHMFKYILNRLTERSTWLGLLALATACGATIEQALADQIIAAGMAAAGLIGIVTKDRKKEQENHDNG